MEVWFKNAIFGESPVVGYDRTIANTGFPLHRYETIPSDVLSVKNAPLLYHMGHFNSFSDTDYGILSVASPTTFAFTVRMMTCLVVVRVTRDIMFIDVTFSSNNNGPVTILPKYPDDNVFGSHIVNDLKVSTLSFKVHMKGNVMVMMDMQTKYVYRFVSGHLVGTMDADSVYHGTTKEIITVVPLEIIDKSTDMVVTSPNTDTAMPPLLPSPDVNMTVVTQRDDRFLRAMMLQCLDDICDAGFEQLMVDKNSTETSTFTIPSTALSADFGMEWINPAGYLTMFRSLPDGSTAVAIVAGCFAYSLESSNTIPNMYVSIMKGIAFISANMIYSSGLQMATIGTNTVLYGTDMVYTSSLRMTVVPMIIKDSIITGTMTITDTSRVVYSNILPPIARYVTSWTIKEVIATMCTVPLVVNGAMVVGNKIMNGTKYVNDPNESYIHAITRENTDLVVGTVNDIVDGIREPWSEGLKNVSQLAIITGLSITAAIVLVNQSQYQWLSENTRPNKRIKKK